MNKKPSSEGFNAIFGAAVFDIRVQRDDDAMLTHSSLRKSILSTSQNPFLKYDLLVQIERYDTIATMPPKFDPLQKQVICFRVYGGSVAHVAVLAPKVGPLGLSPKKIGEDIAVATKDWSGMRVWVQMTVQNRVAVVQVRPTTSNYIIQALKEPPGRFKKHHGSLSLQDVIDITRKVRPRSQAQKFEGTFKEVLGTCVVIGCKVDGRDPRELTKMVNSGELQFPDDDECQNTLH
jgi:large subunit ribosomal protein L12e